MNSNIALGISMIAFCLSFLVTFTVIQRFYDLTAMDFAIVGVTIISFIVAFGFAIMTYGIMTYGLLT